MNPGRRARIETEERFMIPALTIDELQMQAQRRLPKPIYDFIDGAAYDEATKVANRQDFLSLRLRQRVLRDIAVRDHGTTILGQKSSMPAMISPVGMRSEEHTSELQSLMRISYAVFCLKKKKIKKHAHHTPYAQ